MILVPDIVLAIVALALLLLVLAGLAFVRFLHDATTGLPFPLNAIAGWVLGNTERILTTVRGWAIHGLAAVGAFFLAAFDVPRQLFDSLVTTLEKIWTLGATLRAAMTTLYHQSLTWAWTLAVSVQHTVAANLAHTEAEIGAVRSELAAGLATAASDLGSAVRSIDGQMAQDVTTLGGVIDAGISDLAHALVNDVAQAEGFAAQAVAGAVSGLEADIAAARSDVIDWANGIAKDLAGSIEQVGAQAALGTSAAVAGILAFIQSGVMATVATITTELDDCLRPNCTWLHALGGTLGTLATDLMIVALMAFLVQAVADPGAAATEAEDLINPIATEVYGAMSAVLGALY
ncbi:MAG: hypothetical protein ACYCSJ_01455 [Acidimicrobiales bacterium]